MTKSKLSSARDQRNKLWVEAAELWTKGDELWVEAAELWVEALNELG